MKIPHDKLMHFFIGALISFPLVWILGVYGFMISLIGFALKEVILDWLLNKGKPEFADFAYSAIAPLMFLMIKCFPNIGL